MGKLEPASLLLHVDRVISKLEHSDSGVREAAVEVMGKLEPASLLLHIDRVISKLEDSDSCVREAAVKVMGKLDPSSLAPLLADLTSLTIDSAERVISQLGSSSWKAAVDGVAVATLSVTADLQVNRGQSITRNGSLIAVYGLFVTAATFEEARLTYVEWRGGKQRLSTWHRI